MTDDERRRAEVHDELDRAAEALRSAEALRDLGLAADAVSRAYYAAYHALRALLRSRRIEPKSHGGALPLFNTELVRTGLLPTSHNRLLAGLQRARELADYDASVRFSSDDATAEIDAAQRFLDDARALLQREGWGAAF